MLGRRHGLNIKWRGMEMGREMSEEEMERDKSLHPVEQSYASVKPDGGKLGFRGDGFCCFASCYASFVGII